MRFERLGAVCLLSIAALDCRSSTAPVTRDILAHRAKWETHALTRYSYVYEETGYNICCTQGKLIRLVVLNGLVSSAVFADTGQPVPGPASAFPTIDALFDRAERAAEGDALNSISYDGALDYPTRMDFAGPPDASGAVFAADLIRLP